MSFSLKSYSSDNLPRLLRESPKLTVESRSTEQTSQVNLSQGGREEQSQEVRFFDQINLDEALEIYSVVRSLEPENSMEIGFCSGGSGLAILQALEDAGKGIHFAVDPYQTSYAKGQGRYNVQAAGLAHRIRFLETFPENAIAEIPRVQFAFIDASHLFDYSMLDYVLADKRLDVGGVLALHDLWMPSLQKLFRYIVTNRHYELLVLNDEQSRGKRRPAFHVKKAWASLASRLPFLGNLLAPEILKPWSLFEVPNLVFLRKIKEDDRDWRFHANF